MSGQADKRDALSNAKSFFEDIWSQGDYWQLESSEFEDAKYKRQVELISDRRYGKALELGCASGVFTRMIAPFCDEVIALDISQNAIDRARSLTSGGLEQKITFLAENAMEYDLTKAGPWDLVTLCETICYLGWLYPFFDVAWMITRIYNAIRPGGRLLMTNTLGLENDYLLLPSVIRTYEDLARNVGFVVEKQTMLTGQKKSVQIESSALVFTRPA